MPAPNPADYPKPLSRAELDHVHCDVKGCNSVHDDGHAALFLHPRCHRDSPTWACYTQGLVLVSCVVCGRPVGAIAVRDRLDVPSSTAVLESLKPDPFDDERLAALRERVDGMVTDIMATSSPKQLAMYRDVGMKVVAILDGKPMDDAIATLCMALLYGLDRRGALAAEEEDGQESEDSP